MDKKTMKKSVIGTRHFGDTIDITDPCYKRDVWCRINDVKIIPGDYECVIWGSDEGEWGERVGIIGIYLGGVVPSQDKMKYIGSIGVDAGLAGFFENKPDYSDEEWSKFCDTMGCHDAYIFDEGFCSSSGYGDGEYDVMAYGVKPDEISALEIRFL